MDGNCETPQFCISHDLFHHPTSICKWMSKGYQVHVKMVGNQLDELKPFLIGNGWLEIACPSILNWLSLGFQVLSFATHFLKSMGEKSQQRG